eukprot:scaffold42645_cov60-Phaeocystis_antarctica.AAC.2
MYDVPVHRDILLYLCHTTWGLLTCVILRVMRKRPNENRDRVPRVVVFPPRPPRHCGNTGARAPTQMPRLDHSSAGRRAFFEAAPWELGGLHLLMCNDDASAGQASLSRLVKDTPWAARAGICGPRVLITA